MQINAYAISGLLIVATCLPLFVLIFAKGKTKVSRLFALHILTVLLWGVGAFAAGANTNPEYAQLIWKLAKIPACLIAPTIFHTIMTLTGRRMRPIILLFYLQAGYFITTIIQNKIVVSTELMFGSIYFYRASDLYRALFAIWLFIVSWANVELWLYARKTFSDQKRPLLLLALATFLGFSGGVMNFLPGLGIPIFPAGNFAIPIYFLIVTYAILKHQLLNIEIIIKRSIAYTLILTLISMVYLLIVVLFERLFQAYWGYKSIVTSLVTAFTLGLLFIPLRNRIQYYLDKWMFKGTTPEIAQENEYLRKEVAQAEKMKAVATLASGMAHEIRNPLTVIQTFFDQLPAKKDNPEFMRQLDTLVGKEVNRINDLVTQLLEFSKPSPLSLQETNVRKLIEDCLNLLGGQFSKYNIQIVKNFGAGDRTLKADANKLKQVFLNLFMNAIDAMPDGGTLTVSVKPSAVSSQPSAKSLQADSCLLIAVQDTGCGITPTDLKHIFEPFYTTKQKGTGLGLAVCKNIVEEHGGKISAASTVGQGTTFNLKFPTRHAAHAS